MLEYRKSSKWFSGLFSSNYRQFINMMMFVNGLTAPGAVIFFIAYRVEN